MTIETTISTQTFFKIALTDPLDDLKEAFMAEYADDPEMLRNAGLIGE